MPCACSFRVGLWVSAMQRDMAFLAIPALTNIIILVRRDPVLVTADLGADVSAAEGITCECVRVLKDDRQHVCAQDGADIVHLIPT